ncbi:MAG: hypothetical protein HY460_00430 [Parcubacteria group bacterium]|nr:hypothetical protein [Parcubacteria group bacterium]
MKDELQILGLTHNEAVVYEALVKSGQTKAGQLIARLDIHRNIVYEALDSLIRKGFVTKIDKRGVWWFQITEPDSILTMLKRREQIADGVIKEIKQARQQIEQQITVYEGVESLRAYWLSTLERFPEGTTDYCIGLPPNNRWEELMGESALKKYVELRARKKFIWKTVLFELEKGQVEHYKNLPGLTEYRLWPRDIKPVGNFNVMHDTVILQTMTDSPRIIEIRDKDIVTVFKNYFDAIWQDAKPVSI